MRYVIWIVFAGLLLIYVLAVQPRGSDPQQFTARALSANHRMQPADLVDWPRLAPQPGRLAVSFPAAGDVNAGDGAMLCPASAATPREVIVSAVLCDRRGGQCIGIAALTPAQANAVVEDQQRGGAARLARNCGGRP
jgi:hypothetical protein